MVKRALPFSIFSAWVVIFLFGCTDPSSVQVDERSQILHSGAFYISTPQPAQIYNKNSSIPIQWTTNSQDEISTVKIQLCKDTLYYSSITSATNNDESYSYSIPSSTDTGTTYRIKIMDVEDTTRYDYSGRFSILSRYSGTITVTSPTATTSAVIGNSLTVRWSTTGDIGDNVRISLYQDTSFVRTVTSSTGDDGLYSFTLSSSYYSSGSDFKIRVASYYDEDTYGESESFAIGSQYDGSIEVTAPTADSSAVIGETMSVRWNTTGEIGGNVRISLYQDSSYVRNITSSTSDDGFYSFSLSSSYYSSGENFQIRVASYYDNGIYDESELFSIASQYSGSVDFTYPNSTSTWDAGASYSIQWETKGSIGGSVKLYLTRDSSEVRTISSSTSDDGTYSWSIPSTIESGSRYQIKLTSYYDEGVSFYSEPFGISGIKKDTYEPDSTRSLAAPIDSLWGDQERSMTENDDDWISFTGEKGKSYLIQTLGTTRLRMRLYYEMSSSYELSTYKSSSSATSMTSWYTPDTTGTFYVWFYPYSSSYSSSYGNYTIRVTPYDPFTFLDVTSPQAGVTWASGETYTIGWNADSTSTFDSYLSLDLCRDTTEVHTINSSTSANGGSYSWSLPSGLESGSDYRIKFTSSTYTGLVAYSDTFTISGVQRDSWEDDDTRAEASTIGVDGTVQNRTLSRSEYDWVKFPTSKGNIYAVTTTGSYSKRLYLYKDSLSSSSEYESGSSVSIKYHADTSTNAFLRIYPYSSSYTGPYTLSVKEYDPANSVTFSNPTANATLSAGQGYPVSWTADTALYSRYVELHLCKDTTSIATITSSVSNLGGSGTYTYALPAGLAQGTDYRIRIRNNNDFSIRAFSSAFTITGTIPDSYEYDDVVDSATAVPVDGTKQTHSLTLGDEDWFSFDATLHNVYTIETFGSTNPRLYLYSTDGKTEITSDYNSGESSNAKISWYCNKSDTYYFSVEPYSSSYYGEYQTGVKEYDSTSYRYSVTSPATGSTQTAGTSCTITWSSGLSLAGTIDIFLFDESSVVQTIASNITNGGSYTWSIPASLTPKSTYKVKVSNHNISEVFGFSDTFSVVAGE